jgi:potassium-dependent mechanosensitive channel
LSQRRPYRYRVALMVIVRAFLGSKASPSCLFVALVIISYALLVRAASGSQITPPSRAESAREAVTLPSARDRETDQAIPLPQVADRAEELNRFLEDIYRQMSSAQESLPSQTSIEVQADEIRSQKLFIEGLLAATPNVLELRDEELYWITLNTQYASHRKLLTSQATYLEDRVHFLDAQQLRWEATWAQARATPGIQAVVVRLQEELGAIRAARLKVQEQLNLVLTLQNQVSQQDRQISEVLAEFAGERQRLRGHLLERDGPPLWEASRSQESQQPMITAIGQSFDRESKSVGDFVRAHKLLIFCILLAYGLALAAAFKLKSYAACLSDARLPSVALVIFSRPYSVALLVALLGMIGRLTWTTTGTTFIVVALWLFQALRLLPPLIEPEVRPLLYAMPPFLALEGARVLTPFSPVLRRELFLLNILAALVIFAWLARPSRLHRLHKTSRISWLLVAGVRIGIALLAATLAANFFGFLSLSHVLGLTGLLGVLSAAIFYGAARVLSLILITVLRTDWVQGVFSMRAIAAEIWGERILTFLAAVLWIRGMLHLFTVYDEVMVTVSSALQYPFGYGNVHVTIGGTLSVLLVLAIGYALAGALTFLLKRFLLPRLPLHRGVAYAVSTVTYYLLLLVVGVAALADAGVELNKFTVLTGALGVGLGFGLQNIVNNFVSGLILLFERPIHVGDVVDVGGIVGTVKRIGARSSTVLSFQGAEVIVPNSSLISNQVINWTLSSPWRRVDIPIGVAYGTDPERVLKLLVGVAKAHPGVLLEREPEAFFLGFGDSTLRFELRFWSARQDTWFQLQSVVTVAVAKALRDADIEIPFPQRDLHLRSVDVSLKEQLAANPGILFPAYVPGSSPSTISVSRSSKDRNSKDE